MKIRNTKTGVEISSPHIRKGSYNGDDVFLNGDDVFLNENYEELFYLEDGWEEVKEDEWHDLRKNPEDLPSDDRDVLCCIRRVHDRYYKVCCCYIEGIFDLGWDTGNEVLAWRELPKFNEDSHV